MRRLTLLLLVFAASAAAQETAESPEATGDGGVSVGGLVQTQFNTSSESDDDTRLFLRRVRLSANARLTDRVSGRIQAELAGAAVGTSAELNEAYALFEATPAVGVLVGKGGRPFGAVDATTAARLIPIERGARFRGATAVEQYRLAEALAYAGRSVGVQVLGDTRVAGVGLAYAAGYFSGSADEDASRDADIRQFAARVQVEPVAGVRLGAAATSRAFAADSTVGLAGGEFGQATGADPAGETRRGASYSLDAGIGTFGEPGLQVLGEVVFGTLNPFTGDRYHSGQLWLAYRLGGFSEATGGRLAAVEPIVRVSYADPDGPLRADAGTLVTPGLNLYLARSTRLALNADVFLPSNADAQTGRRDALVAFRSQVQIAF